MTSAKASTQNSPLGIVMRCLLVLALCLAFIPLFPQNSIAATTWNMEKSGGKYIITIDTDPYFGGNQWNYNINGSNPTLTIGYDTNVNGNLAAIQIAAGESVVRDAWYGEIPGSSVTVSEDGTHYTLTVPESFFGAPVFTVSYAGTTIASTEVGGAAAAQPETPTEPETPADSQVQTPAEPEAPEALVPATPANTKYEGIVIDGDFADWDAVPKYDVNDTIDAAGQPKDGDTLTQTAMVWDGDYIYIYFYSPADLPGKVTQAGPHGNGNFTIKTDLGKELIFKVQRDYEANGLKLDIVGGGQIAINNNDWAQTPHLTEIAIPTSSLPAYNETISFGFYLGDTLVDNVSNLKSDGPQGSFEGIIFDGNYDDWTYYPHTTIEYATSGTQENVVDAQGALYLDGKDFYAHATTNMPAHLQLGGTEFTEGVLIRFNESDQYMFSPKFGPVGPDGGPVYNADGTPVIYDSGQLRDLMDGKTGTFEFCVFSLDAGHTHEGQINDTNQCYGNMYITLTEARADMEWKLDMDLLSKHLRPNLSTPVNGLDSNDIKTIEVKWQRLGDKWVAVAGTPTGSFLLLAGCGTIAVAGAFMGMRRRKDDALRILRSQQSRRSASGDTSSVPHSPAHATS